jgi:opacity protein-like surface antigen
MWIENLMSQQMRDYLVTGSEILGEDVRGRDRGMAFTVGATYSLPVNRRLRPFFGGGFGFVNLRRDIQSPSRGSFARTFPELTGLNDGNIEPGTVSSNKPLGELMVGYGGQFGRNGYFDVRYRYDRVFDVLENIDFSQVTASIGFSF